MPDITKVDIICIIILILFLGYFIRVNVSFPNIHKRKGNSDDYEDDGDDLSDDEKDESDESDDEE